MNGRGVGCEQRCWCEPGSGSENWSDWSTVRYCLRWACWSHSASVRSDWRSKEESCERSRGWRASSEFSVQEALSWHSERLPSRSRTTAYTPPEEHCNRGQHQVKTRVAGRVLSSTSVHSPPAGAGGRGKYGVGSPLTEVPHLLLLDRLQMWMRAVPLLDAESSCCCCCCRLPATGIINTQRLHSMSKSPRVPLPNPSISTPLSLLVASLSSDGLLLHSE